MTPELGAAVQERRDNTRLLGVYRWRRDKRGRGREGRCGGVAEVSSRNRHGSRFAGWAATAVKSLRWLLQTAKSYYLDSITFNFSLIPHSTVYPAARESVDFDVATLPSAYSIRLSHWSIEFTSLRF